MAEKHYLRNKINESEDHTDHTPSTHDHVADGVPHHWKPNTGHAGRQIYHFRATSNGGSSSSSGEIGASHDAEAVNHVHSYMKSHNMKPEEHHVTVTHQAKYTDHTGSIQLANRVRQVYHKDATEKPTEKAKPEHSHTGPTHDDYHKVLSAHGYSRGEESNSKVSVYHHADPHRASQFVHTKTNHVTNTSTTHASFGQSPSALHGHLTAVHAQPTFHSTAMNIVKGKHAVKEDVKLDEVSKAYVGKYIKAASDDVNDHAFEAGYNSEKGDHKRSLSADQKAQKRKNSIHKAVDKLVTKEEVELEEGLKLVKSHENGEKTAKVYKDTEWGEHRVKFFTKGVHHKDADYHTDDANDAHDTAKHWLKESNIEEGKTFRASGNYKSDNITKSLKKYSSKRKENDKRKIAESENIEELFGIKKAIQHYKDGASSLPVHLRKEPTFDAAKPKHVAVAHKISNKRMSLDQRVEPKIDVPKKPEVVKAPVKRAAASVSKAPSKTAPVAPKKPANKAVEHAVKKIAKVATKAVAPVKKPVAKKSEPVSPPPPAVKPRIRVKAKILDSNTSR